MEHSPVPLIIFSSRRKTEDVLFLRLTWARMRGAIRKMGFILGVLAWPVVLCIKAGEQCLKKGYGIRNSFGISLTKQWTDQVVFGLLYGRPPHIYYEYGFFDKKRRAHVREYITPQEFRGLVDAAGDLSAVAVLNDKLLFETVCSQAGLPCLKTHLIIDSGVARLPSGGECQSLPPEDLFVKPVSAHGGRGCMSYTWIGSGYRDFNGSFVKSDTLFSKLCSISRSDKLLIQPKLRNHSFLEKFGLSGLSTVRVLTARRSGGDIVILRAICKIPMTGSIIDNLSAGGVGCAVDLDSGRLSPGYKEGTSLPVEQHPETGLYFKNLHLPFWRNVLELATGAHGLFPCLPFAGWDIAIVPEGCVLVEGNFFPEVEVMQQAHGPFLGDEKFKPLYLEIGEPFLRTAIK